MFLHRTCTIILHLLRHIITRYIHHLHHQITNSVILHILINHIIRTTNNNFIILFHHNHSYQDNNKRYPLHSRINIIHRPTLKIVIVTERKNEQSKKTMESRHQPTTQTQRVILQIYIQSHMPKFSIISERVYTCIPIPTQNMKS